jgi:carbon-monoxide dehydrogenase small subunit
MLAANTLEQNPDIADEELLDILSSNLCRCTGYQNIIKAVRAAAIEMRGAASSPSPRKRGEVT